MLSILKGFVAGLAIITILFPVGFLWFKFVIGPILDWVRTL